MFGLAQNIWINPKHLGTCIRIIPHLCRHKNYPTFMQICIYDTKHKNYPIFMQICIYDVVLSKRAVGNFSRLFHSCAWSCSLPKVLLIKFCGGLLLSFVWHPAQICTVCIGLIKRVHRRTYMRYSYGYGCSYHETLCKFREIAAATHSHSN